MNAWISDFATPCPATTAKPRDTQVSPDSKTASFSQPLSRPDLKSSSQWIRNRISAEPNQSKVSDHHPSRKIESSERPTAPGINLPRRNRIARTRHSRARQRRLIDSPPTHPALGYRNLVSCCHDCNSKKKDRPAQELLRWLYRDRRLSATDLRKRLRALDELAAGKLKPSLPGQPRMPTTDLIGVTSVLPVTWAQTNWWACDREAYLGFSASGTNCAAVTLHGE